MPFREQDFELFGDEILARFRSMPEDEKLKLLKKDENIKRFIEAVEKKDENKN